MTSKEMYIAVAGTLGLGNAKLKNAAELVAIANEGRASDISALSEALGADYDEFYDRFMTERERAGEIVEYCDRNGIGVLTLSDGDYPALLRGIKDAPAVLYYLGKKPTVDDRYSIAFVGSRMCREKYARLSYRLGRRFAAAGAAVVSGMAVGIDGMAQRGAVDAHGYTIAVLGTGVDVVFPESNRGLYNAIVKSGTVVSEAPPGSPPLRMNFPLRNRIISGLSRAVVVVQANSGSGSLITAEYAVKQGRLAMTYAANSEESECDGNQQLIDEGLTPVFSPEDIAGMIGRSDEEYGRRVFVGFPFKDVETPFGLAVCSDGAGNDVPFESAPAERGGAEEEKDKKRRKQASDISYKEQDTTQLSAVEKQVWLAAELPVTADEIAHSAGLPVEEVLTAVTMLEISGYIEALPGGKFVRA